MKMLTPRHWSRASCYICALGFLEICEMGENPLSIYGGLEESSCLTHSSEPNKCLLCTVFMTTISWSALVLDSAFPGSMVWVQPKA